MVLSKPLERYTMKIIKISALWCMSCLIMHNRFEDLKKEYALEIIHYDIDTDDVSNFNIGNILPVCILLDENGQEIERIIGEISTKNLRKILEKYQ